MKVIIKTNYSTVSCKYDPFSYQ